MKRTPEVGMRTPLAILGGCYVLYVGLMVAWAAVRATAQTPEVDPQTITIITSDGVVLGPFTYTEGAYNPDGIYTVDEAAQNAFTLYYSQYRVWTGLVRENERIISCPEDVNGNGMVDFDDLIGILSAWGEYCPTQ